MFELLSLLLSVLVLHQAPGNARSAPAAAATGNTRPGAAVGGVGGMLTAEALQSALSSAMTTLSQGGASQRRSPSDQKRLLKEQFISRLESGIKGAEAHGDPRAITKARGIIPVADLEDKGNGKVPTISITRVTKLKASL